MIEKEGKIIRWRRDARKYVNYFDQSKEANQLKVQLDMSRHR